MQAENMNTADNSYNTSIFGANTYIFSPQDDPAQVNNILAALYQQQEANQFGTQRYAIYFMPGVYDKSIRVNVGFYMQVAGLGVLPTDTKIESLQCTARWQGNDPANHNACCNFWRGVENIEMATNTMWAVSQATYLRRVQVDGVLSLHDENGWCSGGFLADSNSDLVTDSGTQQQWLSRNCNWKAWTGSNWNMVFVGTAKGKAPQGEWPVVPYTKVEKTDVIQEKPFLIYDEKEGYMVYLPTLRKNEAGVSWQNGEGGIKLPISDFYLANDKTDTAASLNRALAAGKHLLLTPGIYELEEPLKVAKSGAIVLGMGFATLRPTNGNSCIETLDVGGVILAGIIFDAGEKESNHLVVIGQDPEQHLQNGYTSLSDIFFRVGGAATKLPTKTKVCLTVNSDNVIGDNLWIWRADHGKMVGWDLNTADNGLIVNGDNVIIYALMVEHFNQYQTVWNGENGKVYLYQSEIPYDVPEQSAWRSHGKTKNGYASFHVAQDVEKFEAWGLGIYLYNRDAAVTLETAMEIPDRKGVAVHNICTVMLTGHPGMTHILNDAGAAVTKAGDWKLVCEYENGLIK